MDLILALNIICFINFADISGNGQDALLESILPLSAIIFFSISLLYDIILLYDFEKEEVQ